MSGEDKQDPKTAAAPARGGKAIGRRDILQGLSAVPVLGLFGYAVKEQTSYDNARIDSRTGTTPVGKLNDISVALLGAGDEGEVLLNSMLKIPGLRFRTIGG